MLILVDGYGGRGVVVAVVGKYLFVFPVLESGSHFWSQGHISAGESCDFTLAVLLEGE